MRAVTHHITLSLFAVAEEFAAAPILGPHVAVVAATERDPLRALGLRVLFRERHVVAVGTAGGCAVHDGSGDGERRSTDGPHGELGLVLSGSHGALAAISVGRLGVVSSLQHVLPHIKYTNLEECRVNGSDRLQQYASSENVREQMGSRSCSLLS